MLHGSWGRGLSGCLAPGGGGRAVAWWSRVWEPNESVCDPDLLVCTQGTPAGWGLLHRRTGVPGQTSCGQQLPSMQKAGRTPCSLTLPTTKPPLNPATATVRRTLKQGRFCPEDVGQYLGTRCHCHSWWEGRRWGIQGCCSAPGAEDRVLPPPQQRPGSPGTRPGALGEDSIQLLLPSCLGQARRSTP